MQAFSLEKGFMAEDDLKLNSAEINNSDNHSKDAASDTNKVKLSESNFSVERLLSHNDKDKINSKVSAVLKETEFTLDFENKENENSHARNDLSICEFESLPGERLIGSKSDLSDNFDGQQPENGEKLTTVYGNEFSEIDKLKLTDSNIDNDISAHEKLSSEVNFTKELNNLHCTSLKICDKLTFDSDDPDAEELGSSKENLMRFAEVLYKCTLCTSIPSILTSKESFIKHITEQHLTHQQSFVDCPYCLLKFQTDEDLKEHKQLTHNTESDTTDNSELPDYPESEVLSYDMDTLDRGDDSDSHSSGHRNNNFVFTQSDDNKNASNVNLHKNIDKTTDGSIDLSLKNGHHIKKTLKPEKNKEKDLNRNLPLLHHITDQIVKSTTAQSSLVNNNKYDTPRPVLFTPSYTPEFGKYTKLVREGGNIVYFCQVCNWKSPVKATFSVHCGIADHKRKVIMAERSEKGNSCELDLSKLSPVHTGETNLVKKTHGSSLSKVVPLNGEPVGWKPRGSASSLSLLSEPSGFYLGSKGGTNISEFYPFKGLGDKSHSNNKRKKTVNFVRHQMRLKPKWSDTDSDENDTELHKSLLHTYKSNHPENTSELPSANIDVIENAHRSNNLSDDHSRRDNEMKLIRRKLVIKKEVSDSEVDTGPSASDFHEAEEPSEKKPKLSPCPENSVQNLIDKHVIENIKHSCEAIFKLYKCHLCAFEYSDLREYGAHFEEAHKSIQALDNAEISARKHNDRSNTGTPNTEGTSTEQLRVEKIKEHLPDFVKVNLKGNASRDVLLQRISTVSGVPDLVSWSSACNKAMRELFPSSLAQRKGKYKKTYYFGVSLMDESSHEEELNGSSLTMEPETLLCHPLRDLNADIEKLLEHLPTILLWTGDMEKGVYRDDILSVLADTLGDQESRNWGKQCNKAVRIVFPNVDIKRKGKDKITVYFGVDLFNFSKTQLIQPNLFGRPCKLDLNNSGNSSPVSKTQTSPETEKPLNLTASWMSDAGLHKSKETILDKSASCLKDKYLSENNFRVEEYLAKFGGVSMFDSNEEDNDDDGDDEPDEVKCDDIENDYSEMTVTKEELEDT